MAVLQGDIKFPESLQRRLDENYDVVFEHDVENLKRRRDEILAIVVYYNKPSKEKLNELIDDLPNVRAIVNHGVGVNNIDLEAAKARGVQVSNLSGAEVSVADFAFALILAAARNVVQGHARSHNPMFTKIDFDWLGKEVSESAIGIVGMGRIGTEVAKRATQGFNMKVMYYNRKRRPLDEEISVRATYCESLNELLGNVDFVVVTVPGGKETSKMFGWDQFCAMKETAMFINVSRGSVVDQEALVRALKEKKIAGAALDVTDPEPLPCDHPLLTMDNVLITPHIASSTATTRKLMFEVFLQNVDAALQGKELPNRVI
ncbi:glyoxylate/hydroxypyruvate reductase B-like [Oscarella lobularis]|uniref:glyoxylate/hydroxypyruvate reductase B-like n=1 Tax=Oscarella lobularis TaxID=121494 RepID=UPI00331329B6